MIYHTRVCREKGTSGPIYCVYLVAETVGEGEEVAPIGFGDTEEEAVADARTLLTLLTNMPPLTAKPATKPARRKGGGK